jgi:copper chaperone
MAQATFTVTGMTCGHCVSSVTEQISEIDGVRQVDVDLSTCRVTVTSDETVRAAVTEAGSQLAS